MVEAAEDAEEAKTPLPEPTAEQRAVVEAYLAANPYGEQDENGIDLSLLRRNLRDTPTQRFRRHQSAMHWLREVRFARTGRPIR